MISDPALADVMQQRTKLKQIESALPGWTAVLLGQWSRRG